MKSQREVRSQKYQYILVEIPCDMSGAERSDGETSSMLNFKSTEDALYYYERPEAELERINQLLVAELLQIIEHDGTPAQREVCELYMQGLNTVEIAQELDCNQSSIIKTLMGTPDPSGRSDKMYGGIANKIRRGLVRSDSIRRLYRKYKEIV